VLFIKSVCRGAKVMIANRSRERAEQLAKDMLPAIQAQVVDWEALQSGSVKADVLANSTSVGMAPKVCVW
jgi:shikimate 5-dehydrogenase